MAALQNPQLYIFQQCHNSKHQKKSLTKNIKTSFLGDNLWGLARSFRSLHAFETESYAFLLFFKSCIALYIFSFDFQFFIASSFPPPHFKWLRCNFWQKTSLQIFSPCTLFTAVVVQASVIRQKKVGYSSKTTQLTKYEHKKGLS